MRPWTGLSLVCVVFARHARLHIQVRSKKPSMKQLSTYLVQFLHATVTCREYLREMCSSSSECGALSTGRREVLTGAAGRSRRARGSATSKPTCDTAGTQGTGTGQPHSFHQANAHRLSHIHETCAIALLGTQLPHIHEMCALSLILRASVYSRAGVEMWQMVSSFTAASVSSTACSTVSALRSPWRQIWYCARIHVWSSS